MKKVFKIFLFYKFSYQNLDLRYIAHLYSVSSERLRYESFGSADTKSSFDSSFLIVKPRSSKICIKSYTTDKRRVLQFLPQMNKITYSSPVVILLLYRSTLILPVTELKEKLRMHRLSHAVQ
jgi:hypothetical protein